MIAADCLSKSFRLRHCSALLFLARITAEPRTLRCRLGPVAQRMEQRVARLLGSCSEWKGALCPLKAARWLVRPQFVVERLPSFKAVLLDASGSLTRHLAA